MRADAAPSFLLVPDLTDVGGRIELSEEESHYLTRVCRARSGVRVRGTDGRGALAALRVVETGRRALVEIESCERVARAREAWVLAGSPEGERGDWMVEKLAELGIAVFQPVDCERARWEGSGGRRERWGRLAIAALRQSRRRHLLEIRAPAPLFAALDGIPANAGLWLADPAGQEAASMPAPAAGVAAGLIGPAPGLSEGELARVAARPFRAIALSDSRLRSETAAIAWAGWWSARVGGAPSDRRA